jgi:hypothetical protein
LLQLKKLPKLSAEPSASRNSWSLLNGYVFVTGFFLVVLGGFLHFRMAAQRSALDIRRPAFPELNIELQKVTPTQAWNSWAGPNGLRDTKLDFRRTPQFLENRRRDRELAHYQWFAWGLAATGGCMTAVSLLLPKQP